MTHAANGKRNENETFNEDSSQSDLVRNKTRAVESNNSVGEVSIQTHTRCAGNRHIGEETHSKSRQSRDSSSSSNKITLDFLNTLHVLDIGHAKIRHAVRRADAGATSFRDNRAVDRDDVSHGEESSQTSANLREEVRALAFLRLRRVSALLTPNVTIAISKSSCGGAYQLTCPEPSRRKYLPTALEATATLARCTKSLTAMLDTVIVTVEWFDAFQRQGVGERKVAKTGVTEREYTADGISRQVAWPGAG